MIDYETIIANVIASKVLSKPINSTFKMFELQVEKLQKSVLKKLTKIDNSQYSEDDYDTKKIVSKTLKTEEEVEIFKNQHDIDISEKVLIQNIKNNLQGANIWSNEINFSTAINSKELENIFVDIDLYLAPLKTRFDTDESTPKISSKKIVSDFNKNKIIYGGAGAGKTTLIKKIYSEYITNQSNYDFTFPLVIRFRELDYDNYTAENVGGFYKILLDLLGIRLNFPKNYIEEFKFEYYNLLKSLILAFFNDSKILLITDGFDEIPSSKLKKQIEKEFKELALYLEKSKFILTSRSNDFLLELPNTSTYEICPLTDKQIKLLINKWIKNRKKSKELFDKIKLSPYYDTTMRPLTLSHLCAIYERKKTIPPKPRYVYDFVLTLLLETWDQQRSIVRPSKYADFYIEKKKEFLSNLSYWLSYNLSKNIFNSDDIRKCYTKIHKSHNLPVSQAKKVVTELENHTGIFIQAGFNSYQFSHKSLQEFLTAKYLSALPAVPDYQVLSMLPNETAILISLSANPNYYFRLLNKDFKKYDEHFWNIFLNRLVEEKPDFDEGAEPIVFFLSKIWLNKEIIFEKSFLELFESTNLKIAIKNFSKLYNQNGIYNDYVSYIINDMKTPLIDRNFYPSEIHLQKDIYLRIKKYF